MYHMHMSQNMGHIGLVNLGNTCYLNSLLQCLRHIPDLTVFFHKHSEPWIHKEESKEVELCNAYKTLLTDMWSSVPPGCLRPAGFIHYFREVAKKDPRFEHLSSGGQQDAQEALIFLLDMLHESMKKPLNINVMAEPVSPFYGALMAWKERVAPKYSPIVDYFFGLMEVTVTCKGCGYQSCKYEEFSELILEFPENKDATLVECMNKQFEGELIDEYQCNKCSPDPPKGSGSPKPTRHPGVIQRRFWRLPQNLNIMLKRFNSNGSKCNANFTSEVEQSFTPWFSEKSPEVSKVAKYGVHSIVDHHGLAGGGHYVAQVRSPTTGQWNIYDDQSVGMIGDGKKPIFGRSNYILFFRKIKS